VLLAQRGLAAAAGAGEMDQAFLVVGPAGPAKPVIESAMSAREWRKAPRAIASATGSLTAPQRSTVSRPMPSRSHLASSE
jgi:hypothetical protein